MAFQKIINFRLIPGAGKIIIRSESGNEYAITKTTCACRGFGFHRKCSHLDEARREGLLNLIEEDERLSGGFKFNRTSVVIEPRKEALRRFLKKNNVSYTEDLINRLEPKITMTMKPEECLALARG